MVGRLPRFEVYRITNVHFLCLNKKLIEEDPCSEIRKLLSCGAFYFAKDLLTRFPYDLTRSAQNHFHNTQNNGPTFGTYDHRFLWNRGLMAPFFQQCISPSKWIYPVICGSFGVSTLYAGQQRSQIGIVSRLSSLRPGTRFNVRGVDDNGYVANFVETEVFINVNDQVLSHVQIRGTVPLFWEQPGLQVGSHKIVFRFVDTSLRPFNRHFAEIMSRYNDTIIVNLMSKRGNEGKLSNFYEKCLNVSDYKSKIGYIHVDYHAVVNAKGIDGVWPCLVSLEERLNNWGFFHFDGNEVKRLQTGAVRTNCVDCLDRTNVVQAMISVILLRSQFFKALSFLSNSNPNAERRAQEIFQTLWAENGDNVSRIYTGTGALCGDRSKFKIVQRSATRTIKNNFFDSAKQEAMVALLNSSSLSGWQRLVAGQFLPRQLHFLPQSVLQSILDRNAEFTRRERLKVFVGTWNVNGGRYVRSLAHQDNDIADWLLEKGKRYTGYVNPHADPEAFSRPTDIFAVGFEEIIDLNAGNVVAGKQSSESQTYWGTTMQALFNQNPETEESYVLLCTTQLVGVCIYVFLRLGLCDYVRGLSSASVKTGMHGKAGNKGACAVRFQIGSTSLCFCCSHLTAGQTAVKERNAEMHDIAQRLILGPDKRNVLMHDYVFWFGDLNYRINLPNDEVKSLISRSAWSELVRSDQLSVQREAKEVFDGFSEGPLRFAPTYRYDLFCDSYDTSEKQRCPAWTDRVLWRKAKLVFKKPNTPAMNAGSNGRSIDSGDEEKLLHKNLLVYYRAEIRTSDHRPVAAVFDIDIQVVEPKKRRQVIEEEILAAGPGDATVRITWISENGEVKADDIYQSIVELASSAGTIILSRFRGNDQLLLTFSSPYEAVEAVRCLAGNKLTMETSAQQVVLSVRLNSTPRLPLQFPKTFINPRDFASVLAAGSGSFDSGTNEWLVNMQKLVEEAEDDYILTHGSPPESAVFQPTRSLENFPFKENINTDELRRQPISTMISTEDPNLINLWDDDFDDLTTTSTSTTAVAKSECETVFQSASSIRVPPRPPPPVPTAPSSSSNIPDFSVLKQLLPPPLPLHPVHSCSDLLDEVSNVDDYNGDTGPMIAQVIERGLQPPAPPRNASAHVSPQHIKPVQLPAPPKRLPPPPPSVQPSATIASTVQQQQQPISSVFSSSQPLIDVSPIPTSPILKASTLSPQLPHRDNIALPAKMGTMPPPLIPEKVPPPLPERPKSKPFISQPK
nr:synaptojanin 1 [Hymenolepis microstoma]